MLFKPTKLLLVITLILPRILASSSANCCSLTETELKELSPFPSCTHGTSVRDYITRIGQKCNNCPDGSCRINGACYCPEDFLDSLEQQNLCVDSFNEKWGASIGLEDRHWRSCVRPSPKQTDTFDNCCLLTREELELRVGTSNSCPLFAVTALDSVAGLGIECLPCPFGTCRVDFSCYCPQDFLKSSVQQHLCIGAFQVPYPDSIASKDSRCPEISPPEVLPPEILSSSPEPTPTMEDPSSSLEPHPTVSVSPSRTPSPTGKKPDDETKATANSPSPESEDEDGLSNLEKAGIIVGIITGSLGAVGCVWGFFF